MQPIVFNTRFVKLVHVIHAKEKSFYIEFLFNLPDRKLEAIINIYIVKDNGVLGSVVANKFHCSRKTRKELADIVQNNISNLF